jgi:hypothetical protein
MSDSGTREFKREDLGQKKEPEQTFSGEELAQIGDLLGNDSEADDAGEDTGEYPAANPEPGS